MNPAVIEHRRKSVKEGWSTLVVFYPTAIVFAVVFEFLEIGVWKYFGWAFLLFLLATATSYAIDNFRAKDEFVCRFDGETFEQTFPISGSGESFCVSLSEVVEIEVRERHSESISKEYYLHTVAGQRWQITEMYGNPAKEFLRAIHKACPDVPTRFT